MLDLLGTVTLPALAIIVWWVLIGAAAPDPLAIRRIAAGVSAWFALVAALAAFGAFRIDDFGTPIIGVAVLLPVVVGVAMASRSYGLRARVLAIPPATLIALHAGRLLGAFFIMLHSDGRLPPTFAHTAGWGDIAVALLAVPVAWAAHRQMRGWPALVLAWNLSGFMDLVAAVTLGIGSADSPLRFIWEASATGTVASFPWALIPGFLVPTYLLIHLAIFAQLRRSWSASAATRTEHA